jgi:hemerythrin-like domain-containing protein
MKRHPALRTLSRDHYQALVVSQLLRRAGDQSAGEAQAAFLEFWRSEGRVHFRVEEEVLLTRFAVAGGAHTAAVARVLIEHAEIRLRALRLQGGAASGAVLEELGGLLAEHVELEERELFPAIEQSLDDSQLRKLAADLAAAERKLQHRPRSPDRRPG